MTVPCCVIIHTDASSDGRPDLMDFTQVKGIIDAAGVGEHIDRIGLTPPLAFTGFAAQLTPANVDKPEWRNPVGGAVLAALGAAPGVVVGPVVIVGWNTDGSRILATRDRVDPVLPPAGFDAVMVTMRDVLRARSGDGTVRGVDWDDHIRDLCARIEHAAVPAPPRRRPEFVFPDGAGWLTFP